jgi:RimJ/RimL family protein N-acetyltransferase
VADGDIAQTSRLVIGRLRAEHIASLCGIWCDPAVTRYMGGPRDPVKVREALTEELNGTPETYTLWPVVEKASGEVIGDCGLLEKEQDGQKDIELVYVIGSAHQRRGFGFEAASAIRDYAFARLGLERLVALIEPSNTPSQRLAEKLGFTAGRVVTRPSGDQRVLYALERNKARS